MYTGFRLTGRNAVATRPDDKAPFLVGDAWAKDRSSANADDGTEIDHTFVNRIKANLENMVAELGGNPSDGDMQLANAVMAYVEAQIGELIAAAPGALDTLNELAAALGDDPNFATTIATALAGKQPLNANLTAIAALVAQTYGLNLLTLANQAALRSAVGIGTAGLLDVGTTANKVLQLDGSAKIPAVDGSQITNLPGYSFASASEARIGTDSTKAITSLALNAAVGPDLRAIMVMLSEAKADKINMPNGAFDPLQATTYLGTTTNAVTSTAGKITPTLTYGSNQATSGTGIVSSSGSGSASQLNDGVTATGQWTSGETAGGINGISYVGIDFGVGVTKHIRRVTLYQGFNADNSYCLTSALLQWSDNGSAWTTHATLTLALVTTAQTFDVAASGAHRYWRLLANSTHNGASRWGVMELQMFEQAGWASMSIVSTTYSLASVPSIARLLVQAKPIDAITVNTDLIAAISRDGGTTWSTATLVAETTLADGTTLYVHDGISLAGQPSGSSVKWKVETANSKNVELNGAGFKCAA